MRLEERGVEIGIEEGKCEEFGGRVRESDDKRAEYAN